MNTSKNPIKETKLVIRFFISPIDKKPNLTQIAFMHAINSDLDGKGINISETVLGWIKALEETKAFLVSDYGFGRGSIAEFFEINSEIIEVENV